jgi:hypothetical protein
VKIFRVSVPVVLALLFLAGPCLAEVDPGCGNIDVYSDAVRTSTSEMQSYVQIEDLNLARLVYENGIHMALTAYRLVNACGANNAAEIDAGFAELVETAYTDRVANARETYGWMHAILSTAYKHGDTEDQIEQWNAFAQQLQLSTGQRSQRPQRY